MALASESEVFGSLRAAASVARLKVTGSAGLCEKGQCTFPACREAVDAVQFFSPCINIPGVMCFFFFFNVR